MAVDRLAASGSAEPMHSRKNDPLTTEFCGMPFSGLDIRSTLRWLQERRQDQAFGYIVTPNVDHVVRNWQEEGVWGPLYADAELSLCDSRILSLLARFVGLRLPVVTGSDLTSILFDSLIDPYERVTVIGGSDEVVAKVVGRYGLRNLRHHNPPMGFIRDEFAVLAAAQFVERFPARFTFLCVGSPQQEVLAQRIKQRGLATGAGLCVGASLLFLSGDVERAPDWMQRARLEWLHRLSREPRRLWRRYLIEGPKVFGIAARHVARKDPEPALPIAVSIVIPTFRREHLLPKLIERCAKQGGIAPGAVEILIVDNTSEGTARSIVERVSTGLQRTVRYVHEPRPGISAARNRGIQEAAGDLIAFIDDDELPSPGWLEALLRAQKAHDADVVLGPVRPVFDVAPKRFLDVFRAFYTQSSEAPTGTPLSRQDPFRRGRTGCDRPLASNNALLRRRTCFADPAPFDLSLGLIGGEDTLFFTQLQRAGKKVIWCREALVHERVPQDRLTPRYLLRRKFRNGQITSSTCLRLHPRDYRALAGWMLVGCVQLVLGGLLSVVAFPLSRDRSFSALATAATGAGKLLFVRRFREAQYGSSVVAVQQ
jgi:exopolysaccharide biosynthesis WecB/TagA/CpsF family protein